MFFVPTFCYRRTDILLSKNRHFVIEEPTFCYRRTDILLFINLGNPWRSKTLGGAKYIIKHIYKIYINKGLTSFRPKIYTFV